MSVERQFGVHEIPGTEEPAPAAARTKTTVSAGFELQMRGYVTQLWEKLVELEDRVEELSSSRPDLLGPAAGEAKGERYGDEPGSTMVGVRASPPKPRRTDKPWEAEGVSRRTWRRRHKEATP